MQLGNAIAWQCTCAMGYAAAVLAFGGETGSLLGALVNDWIILSNPFVRAVLFLLPGPASRVDTPGPIVIYQHIVVSSVFIACTWIWVLRSSWDRWANDIFPLSIRRDRVRLQPRTLRESCAIMTLGAAAAIMLLLFLGTGSGQSWLMTEKWSYLRAPLLGTAFFGFACRSIVICRMRRASSGQAEPPPIA